jgi:dephospho-CoA kinase
MLVIGLIGGIASGKSFVASCFHDLGAFVLHADELGHCVLQQREVVASIQRLWPDVIERDGSVSRPKLAAIVFESKDRSNLNKLEQLTHPRIGELIDSELARLRSTGCPAAVLDAPVLVEAGWAAKCDKIVFVECPLKLRRQRALARGWSIGEFERREQAQLSLARKLQQSTDLIVNESDAEETRSLVKELWHGWGMVETRSPAKQRHS